MEIIGSIYDAVTDEEAFRRLPALIAEEVDARSCVMQVYAPGGTLTEINTSYFSDELLGYYRDNALYRYDVWMASVLDSKLYNKAQLIDEFVSPDRFLDSVFYNECFRRFGDDTGRCLGLGIMMDGGQLLTVGTQHAFGAQPFKREDAARLDFLIPHLRRLYKTRAALAGAERRARVAEAGLNGVAHAVLLTDTLGRPLLINRAAEALLARRDGLELSKGRLSAADPAAERRLSRAIAEAGRRTADCGASLLVDRSSGARALRALITPWAEGYVTRVLILVEDPDAQRADLPERLAALYGLTTAEAQTAARLSEGYSPEEIAQERSVSMATVRTQIQMALRKTGARRTSEMVGLIARLPRLWNAGSELT